MVYEVKRLRSEPAFDDLVQWLSKTDVTKVSTFDYELEKRLKAIFSDQADRFIADEADEYRRAGYEHGWRMGYRSGYLSGEKYGRSQGITKQKRVKKEPVV